MKIVLTENAERTYFEVVNKYSEIKAISFSKKTISILEMIKQNNYIGSKYQKTSFRKFIISHQVYLFYKVETKIIYVVLFWDNKRSPLSLDVVLSS